VARQIEIVFMVFSFLFRISDDAYR
jgi:hypothetical protein